MAADFKKPAATILLAILIYRNIYSFFPKKTFTYCPDAGTGCTLPDSFAPQLPMTEDHK